jgi:hypothetical protein
MMQSRRSLLIWKIFGRRLDGWENDDLPYEAVPGDPGSLRHKGKPVPATPQIRELSHVGYAGEPMPPPSAVAGTYTGPDGRPVKVPPLTAEDRLTLVRWVDLGCPIDLTFDPSRPLARGRGWLLDDQRPTLTLTEPRAGVNGPLARILIGMFDTGSGLDPDSFRVVADFPIDGTPAGTNLAGKFRPVTAGVLEMKLANAVTELKSGTLTVSVSDRQGNRTRIERVFSVESKGFR